MPNINSPTVHPILFSSTLGEKKELLCQFTHVTAGVLKSHTELTNHMPTHTQLAANEPSYFSVSAQDHQNT